MERAIGFFRKQGHEKPLAAIGIASFGPVDPDPHSPTFGFITTTPKPGWSNTDFAGTVSRALRIPVGFDTDVNGAALAEHRWGAARDVDTFVYLTVGTGIGGGGVVLGKPLHGLMHPEMGHIRVPHNRDHDPFEGVCPYHGDCLEGLASGPAIEARWNKKAENLPINHAAWPLEAHYLALGLTAIICTLSPQRIVLGGGVMQQPHLFPLIRLGVQELLSGYLQRPEVFDEIDRFIVPSALGVRAGVLGAIALAQQTHLNGVFQS
jgi:fructokinase